MPSTNAEIIALYERLVVTERDATEARAALAASEKRCERFRRFITEEGHAQAFAIWHGRAEGWDDGFIKMLEEGDASGQSSGETEG